MPSRSRWSPAVASAQARCATLYPSTTSTTSDVASIASTPAGRVGEHAGRELRRRPLDRRGLALPRDARATSGRVDASGASWIRRCSESSDTESWRAAATASARARSSRDPSRDSILSARPRSSRVSARMRRRSSSSVCARCAERVARCCCSSASARAWSSSVRSASTCAARRPRPRSLRLRAIVGRCAFRCSSCSARAQPPRPPGADVGVPARFFERGAFLLPALALAPRRVGGRGAARRARPRRRARTCSRRDARPTAQMRRSRGRRTPPLRPRSRAASSGSTPRASPRPRSERRTSRRTAREMQHRSSNARRSWRGPGPASIPRRSNPCSGRSDDGTSTDFERLEHVGRDFDQRQEQRSGTATSTPPSTSDGGVGSPTCPNLPRSAGMARTLRLGRGTRTGWRCRHGARS